MTHKEFSIEFRAAQSRSQPPFFLRFLACRAAFVAISNTSLTPSLVRAEHSMYLKFNINNACYQSCISQSALTKRLRQKP